MKSINLFGVLVIVASSSVFADSLPVADSGIVSLFPGQAAQLNIVNVGDPIGACSFSLSFIDGDGNAVASTPSMPMPGTIKGGESVFSSFDNTTASSMLLRAHIDFSAQFLTSTDSKDPMQGCYNLIPTLEIMDQNTTQVLNTQFYGMPSPKKGEKIEKVKICHKPGTPAEKTLEVAISATKGHVGHGDRIGNCLTK